MIEPRLGPSETTARLGEGGRSAVDRASGIHNEREARG